jgi:hypothetical protein
VTFFLPLRTNGFDLSEGMSSEARIPKEKNIERDLPGHGVYLQSQWNFPNPATHGAFRSQTDRKLLPDDSKGKGTLAGFMIDIVDKIKA